MSEWNDAAIGAWGIIIKTNKLLLASRWNNDIHGAVNERETITMLCSMQTVVKCVAKENKSGQGPYKCGMCGKMRKQILEKYRKFAHAIWKTNYQNIHNMMKWAQVWADRVNDRTKNGGRERDRRKIQQKKTTTINSPKFHKHQKYLEHFRRCSKVFSTYYTLIIYPKVRMKAIKLECAAQTKRIHRQPILFVMVTGAQKYHAIR